MWGGSMRRGAGGLKMKKGIIRGRAGRGGLKILRVDLNPHRTRSIAIPSYTTHKSPQIYEPYHETMSVLPFLADGRFYNKKEECKEENYLSQDNKKSHIEVHIFLKKDPWPCTT